MNQEPMFTVPTVPKSAGKFTAFAMRTIAWYADNYNLKVELSTPPNVTLSSRDLHETHSILLSDIIEEYRRWRKEETKRKAREEKQSL